MARAYPATLTVMITSWLSIAACSQRTLFKSAAVQTRAVCGFGDLPGPLQAGLLVLFKRRVGGAGAAAA